MKNQHHQILVKIDTLQHLHFYKFRLAIYAKQTKFIRPLRGEIINSDCVIQALIAFVLHKVQWDRAQYKGILLNWLLPQNSLWFPLYARWRSWPRRPAYKNIFAGKNSLCWNGQVLVLTWSQSEMFGNWWREKWLRMSRHPKYSFLRKNTNDKSLSIQETAKMTNPQPHRIEASTVSKGGSVKY